MLSGEKKKAHEKYEFNMQLLLGLAKHSQQISAGRVLKGLLNKPPSAEKHWRLRYQIKNTFWSFKKQLLVGFQP